MSLFVLSLRHMSINTIAKVFWSTPSVKELMKTTFIYDNTVESFEITDKNDEYLAIKQKFYTEAYQQFDKIRLPLPLPSTLQCPIRQSVRIWGESVFTSLTDILRMISAMGDTLIDSMENFIENICFTNCGTVDTSATFRKLYCAEPRVVDYYMWTLACELCLEEYILQWYPQSERRDESTKAVKLIFNEIELETDSAVSSHLLFWENHNAIKGYYHVFLMYWKLWKSQEQTTTDWSVFLVYISSGYSRLSFYDQWEIYDPNQSIEENMFKVSVVIGNFQAVKYFWNKLSTEAKSRRRRKMLTIACLYEWQNRYDDDRIVYEIGSREKMLPERAQYFDIICFLIKNMTESQLDDVFSFPPNIINYDYRSAVKENLPIILLMNEAKYPEFCVNIVPKTLEHFGNEPWTYVYVNIVWALLDVLSKEAKLHGEYVFTTFLQLWRFGPVDSESKLRSWLKRRFKYSKKLTCDWVLHKILHDPRLPKFVKVRHISDMYDELNEKDDEAWELMRMREYEMIED